MPRRATKPQRRESTEKFSAYNEGSLSDSFTGGPSSQCEEFFFFNLNTNVQRAKRDTVTADIYYYMTTEFGYAKRDLRLAFSSPVLLI